MAPLAAAGFSAVVPAAGGTRQQPPRPLPQDATPAQVQLWLRTSGFAKHGPALAGLDGPALAVLPDADLRARGIPSWGERTKMIRAIRTATSSWSSAAPGSQAASDSQAALARTTSGTVLGFGAPAAATTASGFHGVGGGGGWRQ